jgi:hypothetical protein
MRILLFTLWLLLASLLSAIGYRVWSRRLYSDYPLFFAYIIAHLIRIPVVFYYYRLGTTETYRHVYVYAELIDALFKFGVIYELFSNVSRRYDGIRSFVSALLGWATVALLLLAIVVAASSTSYDSDPFLTKFFAMERSVEIVQGGLLSLLFALSASLGLNWKQHAFGIALGFGVVTSVNLATFTLRARLGTASQDVLSLVSSAGYNCALLVWTVTLFARKPIREAIQFLPHWDVESWNRALVDFLRR